MVDMCYPDKLLPVGSVVMLKNAEKSIMITGFYAASENDKEKIYDYSACLYPEGMVSSDKNLLFNHDEIEKVMYFGYSSDLDKEFKRKLNEGLNRIIDEESKKVLS